MPEGSISKHDDDLVDMLLPTFVGNPPHRLADVVRFDHAKQLWHIWDGVHWKPDKQGQVYELVRDATVALMRDADSGKAKVLSNLLDRAKKESVLKSMSVRRGIAMAGDEWNPDPTLLAFTNGVLDLKTLEFSQEAHPDWLISRSTRQVYDPAAKCPRFLKFLTEVMGDDREMVGYLGLVLGYSLFGWQREQKFWMLVGQGQNGKGTMAKAVAHALGDYADTPSAELYMKTRFGAARSDAARPDLLRLQGVRFTWMSEPSGGQFHEELLKSHTGDDPIVARDLYGKASSFTTFRPSHTIFFLTNNPPRTEDVGASMQRRVRIIKFDQDFRGDREDKGLEESMKAESAGILALLAKFAQAWYTHGLPEPAKVTEWSNEYIEDNDPIGPFVSDACVVDRNVKTNTSDIWGAYQEWCIRNDADPGSQMGFSMQLARRFKKVKTSRTYVFMGIRPKSAVEVAEGEA